MKMYKYNNPEIFQQIDTLLNQGKSVKYVSKQINISEETIVKCILHFNKKPQEYNLHGYKQPAFKKSELEELVKTYKTYKKIAEIKNISYSTVIYWAEKYGMKKRIKNKTKRVEKNKIENHDEIILLFQETQNIPLVANQFGVSSGFLRYYLTVFEIYNPEFKCKMWQCGNHGFEGMTLYEMDNRSRCYCVKCMYNPTKLKNIKLNTGIKILEYRGNKCEKCFLEFEDYRLVDFHHKDKNKDFNIAGKAHYKWETLKKEIDKCSMLCASCHRKEHNRIDIHKTFECEIHQSKYTKGNNCRLCYNIKNRIRRYQMKDCLVYSFGNRCWVCNIVHESTAYDLHHIDPIKKTIAISDSIAARKSEALLKEASNLALLCATCHRKVEYGMLPNSYKASQEITEVLQHNFILYRIGRLLKDINYDFYSNSLDIYNQIQKKQQNKEDIQEISEYLKISDQQFKNNLEFHESLIQIKNI